MTERLRPLFFALLALLIAGRAAAFDPETQLRLTDEDSDVRLETLDRLAAAGDRAAIPFLEQLLAGNVKRSGDQIFIEGQGAAAPADADDVVSSNRLRNAMGRTLSALRLASPDPAVRRTAAQDLADQDPDASLLPVLTAAEAKESDADIREILAEARAAAQLEASEPGVRLEAAGTLSASGNPNVKALLTAHIAQESDPAVKTALTHAAKAVDDRLSRYERVGQLFTGLSLGSILLLAALGLAVTYGLMGVINMAHGELMMIGAYATYLVQNLFRALPAELFPYYLPAALPVAFAAAGLVGMAIERLVLRHLYGRSLETLLATWGISLILQQAVRTLFGAQNVGVENPAWMSGSVTLAASLSLPLNRIVIILFSALVLGFMGWLLTRTRLGLFVRAVTQNRAMARCVGVATDKVDMLAFGLGSGIAGLAGAALSQIGNVGPDLGQHYIVDSFMVVVLGGVGQLTGSVLAAMGLGIVSKFLEGISGAVLAEIAVLLFVVIFIQRRPQGLFAQTGRSAEN
jgi:urea transport system permease protein